MKDFVIGGMVDGQEGGPSPIKQPKKIRKKRLKKISDRALLMMFVIIRKGVETITKAPKDTKESLNPQVKFSIQPSNDVLEVVLFQVVFESDGYQETFVELY